MPTFNCSPSPVTIDSALLRYWAMWTNSPPPVTENLRTSSGDKESKSVSVRDLFFFFFFFFNFGQSATIIFVLGARQGEVAMSGHEPAFRHRELQVARLDSTECRGGILPRLESRLTGKAYL